MIYHLFFFSVYVNSGLGSIFSAFNLPAFNMPFNLTMFVFLGAIGAGNSAFSNSPNPASFSALGQDAGMNNYDFVEVGRQINSLKTSILR